MRTYIHGLVERIAYKHKKCHTHSLAHHWIDCVSENENSATDAHIRHILPKKKCSLLRIVVHFWLQSHTCWMDANWKKNDPKYENDGRNVKPLKHLRFNGRTMARFIWPLDTFFRGIFLFFAASFDKNSHWRWNIFAFISCWVCVTSIMLIFKKFLLSFLCVSSAFSFEQNSTKWETVHMLQVNSILDKWFCFFWYVNYQNSRSPGFFVVLFLMS